MCLSQCIENMGSLGNLKGKGGGLFVCAGYACVFVGGKDGSCYCDSREVCVFVLGAGGGLFAGLVTLCWGGPGREGEKGGCIGNNALH